MKKTFPRYVSFFDSVVIDSSNVYYNTVETEEDYTRIWLEQIDRGGLISVNDGFFSLLKEIEIVCRDYLDVRATAHVHISNSIKKDVCESLIIKELWSKYTSALPIDARSLILNAIIDLWINIRVHSFTRVWSDTLSRKLAAENQAKSIRKTLKRKGTDKDSSC